VSIRRKKLDAIDRLLLLIFFKKEIRLNQPEKYYSSKYNKDNQDNHTNFGLAFMTNPGRSRVFKIDVLFFAHMTARGWLSIIMFF
jgi:small-conductance mechanosensitive channel